MLNIRKDQMDATKPAGVAGSCVIECPKLCLRIYLISWQSHYLIPWPGSSTYVSPRDLAEKFSYTVWLYYRGLLEEYQNQQLLALADFAGQHAVLQKFSRELKQEIGHAALVAVLYRSDSGDCVAPDPIPISNIQGHVCFSHTGGDPGLEPFYSSLKTVGDLIRGEIPMLARLNLYDVLTQYARGAYDSDEELNWRIQNKQAPRIKVINRSGEEASGIYQMLEGIKAGHGPWKHFAPDRYGLNTKSTWAGSWLDKLLEAPNFTHEQSDIKGGCANNACSILEAAGLKGEISSLTGARFSFHINEKFEGLTAPIFRSENAFSKETGRSLIPVRDFDQFPEEFPSKGLLVEFWDPSWLYKVIGYQGNQKKL